MNLKPVLGEDESLSREILQGNLIFLDVVFKIRIPVIITNCQMLKNILSVNIADSLGPSDLESFLGKDRGSFNELPSFTDPSDKTASSPLLPAFSRPPPGFRTRPQSSLSPSSSSSFSSSSSTSSSSSSSSSSPSSFSSSSSSNPPSSGMHYVL